MNLQENIIRIKEVMGIYTSDQNIIVEASKKEILIDKLGFSNENAEVLVNAAGPFSVWLGNKLINDGAFEYSKEYLNKVGIMNHVLSKITSIMDWIRVGLNGNVKPYMNMSFEELYDLSREWHDSLEAGQGDFNYNEKNKVLRDYRDENGIGFYWVDLGTNSSDEECNRMGHCGETALGNSLYSLRSTQRFTKDFTLNKSYLTVAVGEKDGLIYQLKGSKNHKPNKKYHPYIVDLILNDDHIQGFGSNYGTILDFKITDLPKQEIVKVYSKKPELFNTWELKNYLKNELGDESADPNDVSVEDKSLQESIRRILREETSSEQIKDVILNGTDFDDWIRAIKMQYGDIVPLFHATTKENSKLIDKEGFKLVDGKNYKSFGKEPILYFQIGKSDYQAKNRPVLYRLDVPFDFLYHANIDMDGPNISDEILFKYVDEETWDDLPYEIKDAITYFIWNDFKLDGTEIFITNRFLNDLTDNIFNNLKPVKIID